MLWGDFLKNCHGISEISNRGIYIGVYRGDLICVFWISYLKRLENFKNYENLIFFLGKNGKQTLLDASKVWEFEYKERKSVTSDDSLILNIKKIRKKI